MNWHTEMCLETLNAVRGISGIAIECGVSAGDNFEPLAIRCQSLERNLVGIDTWNGLQEFTERDGEEMSAGEWSADYEQFLSRIDPYPLASAIRGRVQDVLPQIRDQVAWAWLDMDLHEPTAFAWHWLQDRVPLGGCVGFHDYGFSRCPGVMGAVGVVDASRWSIIGLGPHFLWLQRRNSIKRFTSF